ncbi:pheA operon leader peptide PheL [Pantoea sp. Mb-10]|uniref:PheA operon leader peptide PheL n=1 Tax=Pantoea eucrina TaxID=472693 RepID=A0ABU5LCI9_9GAMM|nr:MULTISPECIES: pheA operon leader peptide PheL [Pantoea]MCE0489622.1 pheA operon leader peptide PheL [Pantoea sp. Mb-10]MCE0501273.1 pheA operon leader peptide PheL [Pantoea sp. Pb-8]MDZ7277583.1 pheA operon leader peptide PheL [Pantoea eucrina]
MKSQPFFFAFFFTFP